MDFGHGFIIILFVLFLYFGYKDDFNRDIIGFVLTIIGVISFIIGYMLKDDDSSIIAYIIGSILFSIGQYLRVIIRKRSENSRSKIN